MSSRSPWTMLCCLLSAAGLHQGILSQSPKLLSCRTGHSGRGHDRQQSGEREGSVPEPRSRSLRWCAVEESSSRVFSEVRCVRGT